MSKRYEAPTLEFEEYELDANIASHCGIVVSNGPAVGNHKQCEDYDDPFNMNQIVENQVMAPPYNVWFYEDTNCDCYYSAADSGYWTS